MIRIVAIAAVCALAACPLLAGEATEQAQPTNRGGADEPEGPRHLLVVRLSSEFFRPRDPERTRVEETTPVCEVVLGTKAVGQAHVQGRVSFDFFPDRDDTGLWLNFTGTGVARTVAHERSAVIHTAVTTEFICRKPLLFDLEQGFRYGSAQSAVRIVSTQRCVGASVGGLRGRLVRRVAERRLASLDAYLNCVARRNTARRLENSFDREANQRLAQLNALFHDLRIALSDQSRNRGEEKYDVSLNTTDRYLQIGVGPPNEPNPRLPDAGVAPLPIQVWLHTGIFGEEAAPLLAQWDHVRFLLQRPSHVSGFMSALRLPDADENLPLEFSVQQPWVVISAGRDPRSDKKSGLQNRGQTR